VTRHHGLTRVTIPSSVTSIGQEAFASHWTTYESISGSSYTFNHWLVTEVTIGANVRLGNNAIGNGFEAFYANAGRLAGSYRTSVTYMSRWERFENMEVMKETIASRNKAATTFGVVFGLLALAGLITWAVLDPDFGAWN
jgi:hypothetical protein